MCVCVLSLLLLLLLLFPNRDSSLRVLMVIQRRRYENTRTSVERPARSARKNRNRGRPSQRPFQCFPWFPMVFARTFRTDHSQIPFARTLAKTHRKDLRKDLWQIPLSQRPLAKTLVRKYPSHRPFAQTLRKYLSRRPSQRPFAKAPSQGPLHNDPVATTLSQGPHSQGPLPNDPFAMTPSQ